MTHEVRVLVAVDFGGLDEYSVKKYQGELQAAVDSAARGYLTTLARQWPGQETWDLSVGSTREEA